MRLRAALSSRAKENDPRPAAIDRPGETSRRTPESGAFVDWRDGRDSDLRTGVGLCGGWVVCRDQLGPNAMPVIRAQIAACDGAGRDALNSGAVLRRHAPSGLPHAGQRCRYTKSCSQRLHTAGHIDRALQRSHLNGLMRCHGSDCGTKHQRDAMAAFSRSQKKHHGGVDMRDHGRDTASHTTPKRRDAAGAGRRDEHASHRHHDRGRSLRCALHH